jgi:hypothetical protein
MLSLSLIGCRYILGGLLAIRFRAGGSHTVLSIVLLPKLSVDPLAERILPSQPIKEKELKFSFG